MSGGRVQCTACGASNFDTVSQCWKCGAALGTPPSPGIAAPIAAAADALRRANTAAIWLGLLFPYVGLPVGLIFLMLPERHRQDVGRTCVIWSAVSMVVSTLFLMLSWMGIQAAVVGLLRSAPGASHGLPTGLPGPDGL